MKIERYGIGLDKGLPDVVFNAGIEGLLHKIRIELHNQLKTFKEQPEDKSIVVIEVYQVIGAKIEGTVDKGE